MESTTPRLTIEDLEFMAKVIDLCSQRGAFRAEELSDVGTLFHRITTFIQANIGGTGSEPEAPISQPSTEVE